MARALLLGLLQALLLASAFLPSSASAEITVRGRAVGPGGKAVEGRVLLLPVVSTYERGRLLQQGRLEPDPVATAKLGADGRFSLQAPAPGFYAVEVEAPGYRRLRTELHPLLEDTDLPTAELQPVTRVTATVKGPGGEPIEGAVVLLRPTGRRPWLGFLPGPWKAEPLLARTGEQGKAELEPAADEPVGLFAWAPGFLPADGLDLEGLAGEVRLEPGVPRPVRVLNHRGEPAAQVLVMAGANGWPAAWTDEEGRAVVAGPASEATSLSLRTEEILVRGLRLPPPGSGSGDGSSAGDLNAGEEGAREEEAREEEETEKEESEETLFELPQVTAVEGQVVDATTGKGLPGAFVWAPWSESAFQRADSTGSFVLHPPEPIRTGGVAAAARGYLPSREDPATAGAAIRLALAPAGALRGRVVTPGGEPVDGAEVSVGKPATFTTLGREETPPSTLSDREGLFRVGGLEPSTGYQVEVRKKGFSPVQVIAVTEESGAVGEPVEVVLPPGGVAYGFVLDEGEVPIPGAQVTVHPALGGSLHQIVQRATRQSALAEQLFLTDEDGRFEVVDLSPGSYDLEAKAAGFAPVTVRGLEIPAGGGETELGTVILAPGVTLQGRVTDREGLPLEGARVRVHGSGSLSADGVEMRAMLARGEGGVTTDEEGRFEVADLVPGSRVAVVIFHEGYLERRLPGVSVPPEAPLTVVLEEAFAVAGRILDPDGEPVHGAVAVLSKTGSAFSADGQRLAAGSRTLRSSADEEGRFKIQGVAAGTYSLYGYSSSHRPSASVEVEVGGEEARSPTLVLGKGATVRGRVFKADGSPASRVRVSATSEEDLDRAFFAGATAVTEETGEYRLTGVATGTVTVAAQGEGHGRVSKVLEVQAAADNVLDLTFEAGLEVSGRVTTSTGAPVEGARVQLGQGAAFAFGGGEEAFTSSSGGFRFSSVGPGRYVALAEKEGWAQARSEPFEVGSEPVFGVELVLRPGTKLTGMIFGLNADELASLQVGAFSMQAGVAMGRASHEGSYELGPLAPGTWTVQMTVEASNRMKIEQIAVEEGVPEMIRDFDFSAGLELAGRVLQRGRPLEGVQVLAQGLRGGTQAAGNTDFDGRFLLSGLQEGPHRLILLDVQAGIHHMEEIEVDGVTPIEVEVGGASIAGVVRRDSDGAPLEGAEVTASPSSEGPGPTFGLPQTVRTGPQGRFVLEDVHAGSWRLTVRMGGFSEEELLMTIARGDVEEVEISLEATEGLKIELLGAGGRPPARAHGMLSDEAGNLVASDQLRRGDGLFHFDTAPPGRWNLQVSTSLGEADATVPVEVPGPPVSLQMPPTGWLTLWVPALDGNSLPASLTIRSSTGVTYHPPASGLLGVQGAFVFTLGRLDRKPLPPGTWHLEVTAPNGESWTGAVSIRAGEVTEVVLN